MPSHEVLAGKLADYERALAGVRRRRPVRLRQGRPHAHRAHDRAARARGKPVLVDPKGEDYLRYRGATMLTPNRAEFRQVAGRWRDEAELATKAQTLRAELGLEALLITRSEEGMSLYTDAGAQHVPASGARGVRRFRGRRHRHRDAWYAARRARGPIASAVRIANRPPAVVVGKLGTAVVHPDELA